MDSFQGSSQRIEKREVSTKKNHLISIFKVRNFLRIFGTEYTEYPRLFSIISPNDMIEIKRRYSCAKRAASCTLNSIPDDKNVLKLRNTGFPVKSLSTFWFMFPFFVLFKIRISKLPLWIRKRSTSTNYNLYYRLGSRSARSFQKPQPSRLNLNSILYSCTLSSYYRAWKIEKFHPLWK